MSRLPSRATPRPSSSGSSSAWGGWRLAAPAWQASPEGRRRISPTWLRVAAGIGAGAVAVVIGLVAVGTFDNRLDDYGIAEGARTLTVLGLVAAAVAVAGYAAVEWRQTGRIESIARQFGTRTFVLMPLAIALNIALGQTIGSALKLPIYLDAVGTILIGVLAGPIAGAATGALSNLAWTFLLAGTVFGSPYAWPFALVQVEIGFVAGLVGSAGLFRSRPRTPVPALLAALAAAVAALGALAVFVVLPFYRTFCGGPEGVGNSLCGPSLLPSGESLPFVIVAWVALALVGLGIVGFLVRLTMDRDVGAIYVLVAGATCGVLSALIAAPIAALVFGGVTASGTDILVLAFLQAGSDLQTAVVQQALLSDSIDKSITYVIVFVLLAAASRRAIARFPQGPKIIRTVED